MEPFFTEEQLNNMSRENLIEIMKIMKEQSAKKDTEIQLLNPDRGSVQNRGTDPKQNTGRAL